MNRCNKQSEHHGPITHNLICPVPKLEQNENIEVVFSEVELLILKPNGHRPKGGWTNDDTVSNLFKCVP